MFKQIDFSPFVICLPFSWAIFGCVCMCMCTNQSVPLMRRNRILPKKCCLKSLLFFIDRDSALLHLTTASIRFFSQYLGGDWTHRGKPVLSSSDLFDAVRSSFSTTSTGVYCIENFQCVFTPTNPISELAECRRRSYVQDHETFLETLPRKLFESTDQLSLLHRIAGFDFCAQKKDFTLID